MEVTNLAKWKLVYTVETDLPFLSGPEFCTVYAGSSTQYKFSIRPIHHGQFKGILRFISAKDPFVYENSLLILLKIYTSFAVCLDLMQK